MPVIGRSISTQIAAHAGLTTAVHGVGTSYLAKVGTSQKAVLPLDGVDAMTGNLTIGAHKILTTNLLLKEESVDEISVKNAADDAYRNLFLRTLLAREYIGAHIDNCVLHAPNTNATKLLIKARDTDVGLVEIARLVGAADPYFQLTLPPVLTPTARPGAPVEGHLVVNITSGAFEIFDGTHFKQELHSIHRTVNYDDTTPVVIATAPAGTIIIGAVVNITTVFAGGSPVLGLGDASQTQGFMTNAKAACTVLGWKGGLGIDAGGVYLHDDAGKQSLSKLYTTETEVLATFTGGDGLTQGVAEVYFLYTTLS